MTSTPRWRCAVCATEVPIDTPFAWRCPRATADDPRHVLHLIEADQVRPDSWGIDRAAPNPFVRYGERLAWWQFARAHGMSDSQCRALTEMVAGQFGITPYAVSRSLSDEFDLEVVVKDETANPGGSHKGRFLVSILLHLHAAEHLGLLAERPPLAIASCGNAALAAAILAGANGWELQVFVPEWVDPVLAERLVALGATVTRCARRREDPPGDPSVLRFREAVAAGAVPFSVQGPENAYCLDSGRTLGWEMAEIALDAVFVQVGGGALAASVGRGLGSAVRLYPVQAVGCAPFARAVERAARFEHPAAHWAEVMMPWSDPRSAADGILDDETYDWVAVADAMTASGGQPVVVTEADISSAWELAQRAGYDVSHTGAAGLAGVVAARRTGHPGIVAGERVGVIMSGIGHRR